MNRRFIILIAMCTIAIPVMGTITDCTWLACIYYGCSNNNCWVSCAAVASTVTWCYTTKGKPLDNQFVKCNIDEECSPFWHCGGNCSVWDALNSTNVMLETNEVGPN